MKAQPERNCHRVHLTDDMGYVVNVAAEYDLPVETVIKAYAVFEQRRANDIAVANGDFHDENIYDLGNILDRIANSLEAFVELGITRKIPKNKV